MLNKIKQFMGFSSKNTVVSNNNDLQNNSLVPHSDFSLQELEILLIALKECNLKGSQIELFYNLVLKVQNKYMSLKSQN
jgi:hypothetical protein